VLRGILRKKSGGGGSTITQQFAKLLFHEQASSKFERLKQKVKEDYCSKLERSYTKEEIIALYFNQYDFLYNAVGIQSAAQVYFNTTLDSLRIEQSAMLVGMAKNSALYNPNDFLKRPYKEGIPYSARWKNMGLSLWPLKIRCRLFPWIYIFSVLAIMSDLQHISVNLSDRQ
jgi:penicillin-binding protein 1A